MTRPDSIPEPHWVRWHRRYDVDGSALGRRLELVQDYVRNALDQATPGLPFRIISLCAGRGHDVIDIVAEHPRRDDVVARLVELDPTLSAHARDAARAAGLTNVDVATGDASLTDAVADLAPANLILLCGIFGNISNHDIRGCVDLLPTLCAQNAVVVWTRHRREPDLTTTVRQWFADAGFEELGFDSPERSPLTGVGAHRLCIAPRPFIAGAQLFTFIGDGSGA